VPDHKKVQKKPDKTRVLLELAEKHMDAGKYDPAESVLSELLSAQPGDPEVCRLLALVHLKRGEVAMARGEIKFLAAAAMRARDYDLAESLIREYLGVDPACVALLELLGRSYEEKGDHASAIAEYERAVDLLLEHPDPDLPTLAAELYANIRSLDPKSPVVERLAPQFASTTVVGAEAQAVAPDLSLPTPPTEATEAPDLSLPTQPAEPVEAPDLSPPTPQTPTAEERVPFPNVNREAPASFRFAGEPPGSTAQEQDLGEPAAPPEVPAGDGGVPFFGGYQGDPSPMGPSVAEQAAPDLSLPTQPVEPMEAPDQSLAAQGRVEEPALDPSSPEYRMAIASQPGETAASSPPQSPIQAPPQQQPAAAGVRTTPRSRSAPEPPGAGTDVAESLSGYLAAFGYFLINGLAELREYVGEAIQQRLRQTSRSDESASEGAQTSTGSRQAFQAAELGRKLTILLGVCVAVAGWVLSRCSDWARTAWRSAFRRRPRQAKVSRQEEAPRREEAPSLEEPTRPEEVTREEVAPRYEAPPRLEDAPMQMAQTTTRTSERARTLPRPRRAPRLSYLRMKWSSLVDSCVAAVLAVVRLVVFFLKVSVGIPLLIAAIAALGWFGIEEKPDSAFQRLTEIPTPRAVQDPQKNGYFLLLGMGAGPSLDPVKVGYEQWRAGESPRSNQCLSERSESGSSLRFVGTRHETAAWLEAPDPVAQFQGDTNRLATWLRQQHTLVSRYRQWLSMPFEDAGYGRFVSPDCLKILVAHRLYLAEGFSHKLEEGIARLEKDLTAWRVVLGQAKTLPLKVLGAAAINEDLAVVSALLNRKVRDSQTFARLSGMARPLDEVEDSLRWPMQNAFLLTVKTVDGAFTWEASSGRPVWERALMYMPLPRQRTLNAYARYYEAAMKAVEIPNNRLPKLHDFARTPPQTPPDYFVNPINNLLATSPEPNWDLYAGLLLETDARLRLVSLQGRLREPSHGSKVLTRIGAAGLRYYDPFTGLPMLWNGAKGRLYSVGRDGKDDEGDPKLDIGVTIPGI